jgi:sugar/nucleoside kinase (ribokinase family)
MIGGIREDYCITHDGRAVSGVLGGNAIYAAVGARLWSEDVTVVSRIGKNFPISLIHQLSEHGISTEAIRVLDEELDTRTFYAYRSQEERIDTNPPAHYSRWGLRIPKELEGYRSSTEGQDQRNTPSAATVRSDDIPDELISRVSGVHLSPGDFLTHLTIPNHLQKNGVNTITLDPSIRYMTPQFKIDLPKILHGITAFLPSLYEARSFTATRSAHVWDMTELYHSMGPKLVVIKAGADGQYLSDSRQNRRWHIPAYHTTVYDVTGAGDAFCGAFLQGYCETSDALEAALRGNIASSFVIEGSGALYALESPSALRLARLQELRNMVRKE